MAPSWRKSLEERIEGLTPVRRELRALRQAHEKLREELVAEQERSREADRKHREEMRRISRARDNYKADRDQINEKLDAVLSSQSFRVGHALARAARFPLVLARRGVALAKRAARWTVRRVLRPAARGVARALRAVVRFVASLPGRIARGGRRLARGLTRSKATPAAQGDAAATAPAKGAPSGSAPAPANPAAPERVIGVPQGNKFLGPLTDGHATTMFLLWGLSNEELDSLVDEVARLQLMQWDFKPIFVTDSDYWDCFLEHGFWFEYIPEAEDWIRHNDGRDWSEFVSERVDALVEAYKPDRVVVYEDAAKRGALRRGVLNGIVSAGDPVVEVTTTSKLAPPAG
jgi:hypothetical protein